MTGLPMTGTDRDVLLGRVLDGEATPEDWSAFRALATREPEVWRDLAEAQQDRASLDEAVARALLIADDIEAPVEHRLGEHLAVRTRRVASWAGWALAAGLAIAAAVNPGAVRTGQQTGLEAGAQPTVLNAAGVTPPSFASPEEALRAYFDAGSEQGRVLGEMSQPVVLGYAPAPGGKGVEVVYLRQIVERTIVDGVYEMAQDETGRQVPVRVDLRTPSTWRY